MREGSFAKLTSDATVGKGTYKIRKKYVDHINIFTSWEIAFFFLSKIFTRKICTTVCQIRYFLITNQRNQSTWARLMDQLVLQPYYLQEHDCHKSICITKKSHTSMSDDSWKLHPWSSLLSFQVVQTSPHTIVCCWHNLIGRHWSSVSSRGSVSLISLPPLSRWVCFKTSQHRVLMNKIFRWHLMTKFKNWQFLLSSKARQPRKLFVVSEVQSNEMLYKQKPFVLTQVTEDSLWLGSCYGRAINVSAVQKHAWMAIPVVYLRGKVCQKNLNFIW